jgi:transcriptional regulator with GAF, ATPase, and Fis domain
MTKADPERELQGSLARLSGVLTGVQPLSETLLQVASFATAAIPGADGAGLTLIERQGPDTMVASEDFVRAVDEVQYGIGEGPCLLAVESRLTQKSGSLGGEPRWPRFGPRAGRLGVHSALSLPLLLGDRVVGALNVYGRARDAFDERSVSLGERFSVPAAVTAAHALLLEESRRVTAQLQEALVNRATIDRALGIIMSRTGFTSEQAFEQLRERSQLDDLKLNEVARQLVNSAVARARSRHRDAD